MTAWLDPVRTDETSRAAVLHLDDVRKTYPGGVEALRGVSLRVARRRGGRGDRAVGLRASRRCCT